MKKCLAKIRVLLYILLVCVLLCGCSKQQGDIQAFKQFSEGTFRFVATYSAGGKSFDVETVHFGKHNTKVVFRSPENINGLELSVSSDIYKTSFKTIEFSKPLSEVLEQNFIKAYTKFMNTLSFQAQQDLTSAFKQKELPNGYTIFEDASGNSITFSNQKPVSFYIASEGIAVEIQYFDFIK